MKSNIIVLGVSQSDNHHVRGIMKLAFLLIISYLFCNSSTWALPDSGFSPPPKNIYTDNDPISEVEVGPIVGHFGLPLYAFIYCAFIPIAKHRKKKKKKKLWNFQLGAHS